MNAKSQSLNLPNLHCLHCGHRWIPRTKKPIKCPLCHNRWDRKPVRDKKLKL